MSKLKNYVAGGLAALVLAGGCGEDNSRSSKLTRWHEGNYGESNQIEHRRTKEDVKKDYVENFAGLNMKMIWIPGADVEIFRDCENYPDLTQRVEGFWIGETEVTGKQWEAFLEKDYTYEPERDTSNGYGGRGMKKAPLENFPVCKLSFLNAKRFADFLGDKTGKEYDLPTYSEWLLACRGPNFPKEGLFGKLTHKNANIEFSEKADWNRVSGGYWRLFPTRSQEPNEYGLYGMKGNAAEFMYIPREDVDHLPTGLRENRKFTKGYISLAPSAEFYEGWNKEEIGGGDFFPEVLGKMGYDKGDELYGESYLVRIQTGVRLVRRP